MSDKYLNVHELKAEFSKHLKYVQGGHSIVIAMRNRPVAELRPLPQTPKKRLVFGVLKGDFGVPRNFDEPLKEFEDAFYGDK
jgi:antitoxin (DNA-binding transcriptional repressor) of toxin-antitoxin stability system